MESQEECYLFGVICAIIEKLHFQLQGDTEEGPCVQEGKGTTDLVPNTKTSVWKALESRVIPKLEELMTKEKLDTRRTKKKIIRPTIDCTTRLLRRW